MGILTTLDAPSFRDEFLPDKYLLRALIYRDLCHYLPAKRAAKELTRRFADSLEAIARARGPHPGPAPAPRRRGPRRHQARPRFLESLELEGERLGRYAGSFGDRLFSAPDQALRPRRWPRPTRVYHDAAATRPCAHEADKLLRAAEQVRLMEYEVGPQAVRAGEEGLEAGAPPPRRSCSRPTRSPSGSRASTGTTSCGTTASASRAAASRRPP